jgi:hypothetical protein
MPRIIFWPESNLKLKLKPINEVQRGTTIGAAIYVNKYFGHNASTFKGFGKTTIEYKPNK